MAEGTAHKRYENLLTDREDYLRSARRSSTLTLPYLIPPEGHSSGAELYKPYQSVGAKGVNNLSSKLLLTLLAQPFFRLTPELDVMPELSANPQLLAQVEAALIQQEQAISAGIVETGDRNPVHEAFKHAIVAGNVLLHVAPEGVQIFSLEKYVCVRDPMGAPVEIVVKESFYWETLSAQAQEVVSAAGKQPQASSGPTNMKVYDVYTHVVRKSKQWYVYQEIAGQKVPESEGQYPLDGSPWIPLRFIRIAGENYGRGYVEEYIGDLISLEALSQAVVDAAEAMAKVIFLVKPNGVTDERTLAEAPNLAVREGNADDVTVVQMNKAYDLRTARETMTEIERRLSYSFLLNRAVQRDAERVTAEEIRFMAQELEDALGGVYSLMSQEFQLPYVTRKIAILRKQGKLPHLPKKTVKPIIITGFDAIGRSHERTKLLGFLADVNQILGPEAMAEFDKQSLIKKLANADAIDLDGLLRDPAAIADEQQTAMRQQVMSQAAIKAAPEVVKAGGSAFAQGIPQPE